MFFWLVVYIILEEKLFKIWEVIYEEIKEDGELGVILVDKIMFKIVVGDGMFIVLIVI